MALNKIGVFGGTFNPIHNGHLHLAKGYRNALGLDRVLFVPTCIPPHKDADDLLPASNRLDMCELATRDISSMAVSDVEIRRGGKSYTVDTLRELAEMYPDDQLYFLMGADMFLTIEEWNGFDEIARTAELCTASRHEGELPILKEHAHMLEQKYGTHCHIKAIPVLDISSTQVRDALAGGDDIHELVPDAVQDYIYKNGLYRP
ncbi:MAG: nicotinate-nucleotide adenylyltransferase [Ethanoligenens sp.]